MNNPSVLPCEIWYYAINRHTSVGECNDEHTQNDELGVFRTPEEAREACTKAGLTVIGNVLQDKDGGYILPVLVVFTTDSRTTASVVGSRGIELTSAINARRQEIIDRAASVGIPVEALRLEKLGF